MTLTAMNLNGVQGIEDTLPGGTPCVIYPDPQGGPAIAQVESTLGKRPDGSALIGARFFHVDPDSLKPLYQQRYMRVEFYQGNTAEVSPTGWNDEISIDKQGKGVAELWCANT